jgi:hypothetical protein
MTSFINILLIPVIEDCDLLNYLSRLNVDEEMEEDNFKYFYTKPDYDGFINSCNFSVDMKYNPEKKYKNIFVMFNGESIESFDKAIEISEKFPSKSNVFLVKCNFGNEVPGELLKKLSECKYEIIEITMGFFSCDCEEIFEISSRDLDKYLKTLKKERKVREREIEEEKKRNENKRKEDRKREKKEKEERRKLEEEENKKVKIPQEWEYEDWNPEQDSMVYEYDEPGLEFYEEKIEREKEFEMKSDYHYIGEIPLNITIKKLFKIMKNAIKLYISEYKNQKKKEPEYDEKLSVLQNWFERDHNEEKFSFLITIGKHFDFYKKILKSL